MSKVLLGTGRRKTSVARVRLSEGSGQYIFNGKKIDDYFPSPSMRMKINKPFVVVDLEKKFDLHVNLNGSGLSRNTAPYNLIEGNKTYKYTYISNHTIFIEPTPIFIQNHHVINNKYKR